MYLSSVFIIIPIGVELSNPLLESLNAQDSDTVKLNTTLKRYECMVAGSDLRQCWEPAGLFHNVVTCSRQ